MGLTRDGFQTLWAARQRKGKEDGATDLAKEFRRCANHFCNLFARGQTDNEGFVYTVSLFVFWVQRT